MGSHLSSASITMGGVGAPSLSHFLPRHASPSPHGNLGAEQSRQQCQNLLELLPPAQHCASHTVEAGITVRDLRLPEGWSLGRGHRAIGGGPGGSNPSLYIRTPWRAFHPAKLSLPRWKQTKGHCHVERRLLIQRPSFFLISTV